MTQNRIKLFRYSLPLKRTLTLRDQSINEREGLIVELRDSEGHIGRGDIAPLPGFSKESINDAIDDVRLLTDTLEKSTNAVSPSVEFGLEAARLNLKAAQNSKPLCQQINRTSAEIVPVNGLVSGSDANITKTIERLRKASFACFKLKVGRESIETDLAKVRRVRDMIGPEALLRLDANRAWNFEEAMQFCRGLNGLDIEYIEEPVASFADLEESLAKKWPVPIALDETLQQISIDQLVESKLFAAGSIAAFVLKPTLLGYEKTMQLSQVARQRRIMSVISSSFESGVGITILAHIAAAVGDGVPAGLDTLDWLTDDLMREPITIVDGKINIARLSPSLDLRTEMLTEVLLHG